MDKNQMEVQINQEPPHSGEVVKLPITCWLATSGKGYQKVTIVKSESILIGTHFGIGRVARLLCPITSSHDKRLSIVANAMSIEYDRDAKPTITIEVDGREHEVDGVCLNPMVSNSFLFLEEEFAKVWAEETCFDYDLLHVDLAPRVAAVGCVGAGIGAALRTVLRNNDGATHPFFKPSNGRTLTSLCRTGKKS